MPIWVSPPDEEFIRLGDRLMVSRQVLVLNIAVRVCVPQPIIWYYEGVGEDKSRVE